MNIVVFIKQVPDNTKLRFDANGPILDGASMMMNPYDEYALETALRAKEMAGDGSTVTVLSLGAASAKEIIKKAVAAGADAAFHLSDSAFDGGDSTANARALAKAVQTHVPDAQLLVFGQLSLDDASGQTGPKVAELLDLPSLTAIKGIEAMENGIARVVRETEHGIEIHEVTLPGVLCVMKCDYELRSSNIKGVMKANKTNIPVNTPADLALEPAQVGAAGASTQVTKTWQKPPKDAGRTIDGSDPNSAISQLLDYLRQAKVL